MCVYPEADERKRFVKYGDQWYLWHEGSMTLHNIHHGFFQIDENAEDWLNAIVEEADGWYDICSKYRWYPDLTDCSACDAWLSPKGEFFRCSAHSVEAVAICEFYYPASFDMSEMYLADDYLIDRGWVKITTSAMYGIYRKDGMYTHLTKAQEKAMFDWAERHGEDFPW